MKSFKLVGYLLKKVYNVHKVLCNKKKIRLADIYNFLKACCLTREKIAYLGSDISRWDAAAHKLIPIQWIMYSTKVEILRVRLREVY